MRFVIKICCTILLFATPVIAGILSIEAKMVVRIVDDNQNPVEGAQITGSFRNYPSNNEMKCITDKEGVCVIKGNATKEGSIQATKEGYYYSSLHFEFEKENRVIGRYEPWGKTYHVVLKKKRNPMPMYARNARGLEIPVYNQQVGFDLEMGDWVAPYGKGMVKDFIFTFKKNETSYTVYKSSFTLQFANERDGLQEYFVNDDNQSFYRWPFEAPIVGYVNKLSKYRENLATTTASNLKDNVNYIFRVRTEIDENGKIIKANYGKIDREFRLGHSVGFTYYFNPDGTSNLEFDPKQNLFKFSRNERRKHRVQRP